MMRRFIYFGSIACGLALLAGCGGSGSNGAEEATGGKDNSGVDAGAGGESTSSGGSSSSTGGRGGATGGDGGSTSIPEDGGSPPVNDPACADDDTPRVEGSVCIGEVKGRIVDSDGEAPETGFGVSVCGPTCFISNTEADGAFTVPIGQYIVPEQYSTLPHGRPLVAGYYFGLDPDVTGPTVDVGTLQIISMPEDGVPIDLDGATDQTLVSDAVTLEIPAGVTTHLEFDDFAAGDLGKQFRARPVDVTNVGGFVPDDLSVLYALGPFESYFEDAGGDPIDVRLSFDNTTGLAADAAVEFLALGSYLYPDWIAPARFEVVAQGHVTSDGARIQLDDGQGLTYLTWVGIRPVSGQ